MLGEVSCPVRGEGDPNLSCLRGPPGPISGAPVSSIPQGQYLGRSWPERTWTGPGTTLVDRQTSLKTLPSRHTTYAGGKRMQPCITNFYRHCQKRKNESGHLPIL